MATRVFLAVSCAILLSAVTALRINNKTNATFPLASRIGNKTNVTVTQKDVDATRANLDKMALMLGSMLKSVALSNSKVAPALKLFADNLHTVLGETKTMKPADAMLKLQAAKTGVKSLVVEMTKQQETLMKEDFESRESLLMGVLMTNKQEAMSKQLDILRNDDFAGLDVSKALLQKHDNKTALYLQAAKYLDEHKAAGGEFSNKTTTSKSHLEDMAASFERRVTALEKEAAARDMHQEKKIAELARLAKKQGGKESKVLQATIKREERHYKKMDAMSKHDIASMKDAATAIRSGDMKALDRARAALQRSLDSLKDKNAGMLVFLQQSNAMLEHDCPYCAAQCVEKCHTKGEPYVSCLTECADAGK